MPLEGDSYTSPGLIYRIVVEDADSILTVAVENYPINSDIYGPWTIPKAVVDADTSDAADPYDCAQIIDLFDPTRPEPGAS